MRGVAVLNFIIRSKFELRREKWSLLFSGYGMILTSLLFRYTACLTMMSKIWETHEFLLNTLDQGIKKKIYF